MDGEHRITTTDAEIDAAIEAGKHYSVVPLRLRLVGMDIVSIYLCIRRRKWRLARSFLGYLWEDCTGWIPTLD